MGRTVKLERSGALSSVIIEPPIPIFEAINIPRPRHSGGEGIETVDIEGINTNDTSTTISFRSWAFGIENDERFIAYGEEVAHHLGATLVREETVADITELAS